VSDFRRFNLLFPLRSAKGLLLFITHLPEYLLHHTDHIALQFVSRSSTPISEVPSDLSDEFTSDIDEVTPTSSTSSPTPRLRTRKRKYRATTLWSYAGDPIPGVEPLRGTGNRQLWYCNYAECAQYSVTTTSGARHHLKSIHEIYVDEEPSTTAKKAKQTDILIQIGKQQLQRQQQEGQSVRNYLKAAADKATVRRALLRLIVRHDLPLTLPTWNETHTLVHSINYMASGILWHAHSTTAYQILQVFEVKRQQLKQQLQRSQSRIHITTDTWHSPNHKEFQAVTAHWLGADNKLHKALISLPEMEAGHAGVKVTEKLLTVLDNYSLKDQLGYITA